MIEVGDRVVMTYQGYHLVGMSGPYAKGTFNAEGTVYEVLEVRRAVLGRVFAQIARIQPCPVASPEARRYAGGGKWIGLGHLTLARVRVAAIEMQEKRRC